MVSPKPKSRKPVAKPNVVVVGGKKVPKYKENLRMNIQQKYMEKLEEQEKKHQKAMKVLKMTYTIQIEELNEMLATSSNCLIQHQQETLTRIRELYDIIYDKDLKVQDLEQKIDDMEDENRK